MRTVAIQLIDVLCLPITPNQLTSLR